MTPIKAIHAFCVECNGSGRAANNCQTEVCEVWHYRAGHRSKMAPFGPLKSIRLRCLDCVGGVSFRAVRDCEIVDCPLHIHRFGKRLTPTNRVWTPDQRKQSADQLAHYRKSLVETHI